MVILVFGPVERFWLQDFSTDDFSLDGLDAFFKSSPNSIVFVIFFLEYMHIW